MLHFRCLTRSWISFCTQTSKSFRRCIYLSSFRYCQIIWMNQIISFPPTRLFYSHENKLISLMRLLFYRIKIFNLMRSHQILKISHFRIKYEYSVFHLKEKISRHAFFPYHFLYTLRCLCHRQGNFRIFSSVIFSIFFFSQTRFNHISKTPRIYLDHHFIEC